MMSVCGCEGGKTPAVSRPATYIEPDFVRQDPAVIEAKLVTVNGVPRMVIDGRQTEPIMMSAMYGYDNPEATLHEIKLAGENGTDIVRTVVNFDVSAPESSIPAAVDGMMKQVLEQNPDALIVMGFGVTAAAYRLPGGDAAFDHFRDQTGKQEMFCSLASEAWIDQACRASKALVEYVLSVPDYAGRVIGYQPCAGSAGEWFGPLFWEGSIDQSPANTAGFRASLKAKYGTDAALRDAWGGWERVAGHGGNPGRHSRLRAERNAQPSELHPHPHPGESGVYGLRGLLQRDAGQPDRRPVRRD